MDRHLHIGGKGIKSLIEIVHLNEDTQSNDEPEDIGAGMGKLIVALECELYGHAEALDCHNAHRPHKRTNRYINHRIRAPMFWRDCVDHDQCEHKDRQTVH